jgi:hypothetical protein
VSRLSANWSRWPEGRPSEAKRWAVNILSRFTAVVPVCTPYQQTSHAQGRTPARVRATGGHHAASTTASHAAIRRRSARVIRRAKRGLME